MSGCKSGQEKETEVLPLRATPRLPLCAPLCTSVPASMPLPLCACFYTFLCACLCLPVQVPACLPLPGNQPLLLLPAPHAAGKLAPSFLFRDGVQPPNDPNNHTHRLSKNHNTQGIDHSICKFSSVTVNFCQIETNHYPAMTQAKLRDAVVGWLWCVYVGQDVPDYQAITGYS